MDNLDFVRSKSLNTVPQRKLRNTIENIQQGSDTPENKATKLTAINRYAESNIPMGYWTLKMEKDFQGDPRLLTKYNEYTTDLKLSYDSASSICFAGTHGVGKTMTITCILKRATHKGYSCLYTTLSDIVNVLTQADSEGKFLARRELTMVDFLAIDEFDPRFVQHSDDAADLFARSLEGIFRTRIQNRLPTLMASNSPNPIESFRGKLRDSIESLMKGYVDIFVVAPGKDFRKEKP